MLSETATTSISTSNLIAGDYFRPYTPSIEPMHLIILGFFLIALSIFARNKFRNTNRILNQSNSKELLQTDTHSEDVMAIRGNSYWDKRKKALFDFMQVF